MPESRKRPGHQYQKPADIPSRQRVKGRVIWCVLFAIFGLIIGFFAAGTNVLVLIISLVVGGILGYFVGKNMEQAATNKS